MRYKVTMLKDLGKSFEETIITDNMNATKMKVSSFNPKSTIVDTILVYL